MQRNTGNAIARTRRRVQRLKVAATTGSVIAFGALFGVVAVRTSARGSEAAGTPLPTAAATATPLQRQFPWAPPAPIPAPATPPRFGGTNNSQPPVDSQPPSDNQSPATSPPQAPIRIHTRTRAS